MLNKQLDDIQIDLLNNIDYLSEWYHLGHALVHSDIFSILSIPFPSDPPIQPPRTTSRGLGESSFCDFDAEIPKRGWPLKFITVILIS